MEPVPHVTTTAFLLAHIDSLATKLAFIEQSIETISTAQDFRQTIREMLLAIRKYHAADSTYIFAIDYKSETITNIMEVCNADICTDTRHTATLPFSLVDFWQQELGNRRYICITPHELETYLTAYPYKARPYANIIRQRAIQMLLFVPIRENDIITGFIGINNPKRYTHDESFLSMISHHIALQLHKRRQEAMLHRRYQEAETFMESVAGNYLFSAKANITQNYIENIRGTDVIQEAIEGLPYTEDVDVFCSHLDADNQRIYRQIFGREHILAAFVAGQETISAEVYYHSDTKGFIWARNTGYLMKQPETGDVIAFLYQADITNEKIQATIMENILSQKCDYIMCIHCMENRSTIISHNPQLDDITAICSSTDYRSYIHTYAQQYLAPDDRAAYIAFMDPDNIWQVLSAQDVCSAYFYIQLNGQPYYKKLDFYCLNKRYQLLAHVRTDCTATHALEEKQAQALRQALEKATQANQAKTEFVSRISHDIRTPLGIISNMLDFAYEDISQPLKLQSDLDKIRTANKFLLSLINDVLDISKIDSGKIELSPEPYTYEEYLDNIHALLKPLCQEKGLHYHISSPGCAVTTILIDKIRFNQITFNLLANAVKYTPAGGFISFSAGSSPRTDGLIDCCIQIQDTGIGMSHEFQKIMFNPFTQEYDNPSRVKTAAGTGLGLSIVKKLVAQMNGNISVSSSRGTGSTFTVHIAAQPAPCPSADIPAQQLAAPAAQLTGRILIVEDNDLNAEIVMRMLESFGLQSDLAENGQLGVQLFAASSHHTYNAILMDIQMPVLDGYLATSAIRNLQHPDAKTIPIIAMTADAFKDALDHAYASGMDDAITKPLDPQLLKTMLSKYILAKQ